MKYSKLINFTDSMFGDRYFEKVFASVMFKKNIFGRKTWFVIAHTRVTMDENTILKVCGRKSDALDYLAQLSV